MNEFPEPQAPALTVTEAEANDIMAQFGLVHIAKSTTIGLSGVAAELGLAQMLKLGTFIEASGGVRFDRGAVMVAEKVAIDHLVRMNDEAKSGKLTLKELKELAYPIGYLVGQIAKLAALGIKSKTILEVAGEINRPRRPSWNPGETVAGPTLDVVSKEGIA